MEWPGAEDCFFAFVVRGRGDGPAVTEGLVVGGGVLEMVGGV